MPSPNDRPQQVARTAAAFETFPAPTGDLTGLPDECQLAKLASTFYGPIAREAKTGGSTPVRPQAEGSGTVEHGLFPTTADLPSRAVTAAPIVAPTAATTPATIGVEPIRSASSSMLGFLEEERLRAIVSPRVNAARNLEREAGGVAARRGAPGATAASAASHVSQPTYYFLAGKLAESAGRYHPGPLRQLSPLTNLAGGSGRRVFDVAAVRRDFPILGEPVNGRRLVWLDNAATTHKPQSVIDRLVHYYQRENSNIHRAAHELAARSTDAYESARSAVARFLHAPSASEIVFTRGATEAINLVAKSWGRQHIGRDDEIVLTILEHHANIVPWQQLAAEVGAVIRVAPVDDQGQVLLDEYQKLFGPRTKLAAFPQVSNALGTVTPAAEMAAIAHRYGARVLVDGAQSVSHMPVDVIGLDADFFVFSGHKVFAPTGIGALFGKAELLEAMTPWQSGGNMIEDVTFERTTYQGPPARFEAGTGSIADAVGLGAAIEYLENIGMENVSRYEQELLDYATSALRRIPGLRIIGTAPDKASVISFVMDGATTEEIGKALNREGIAVRTGHHCAMPILRRFGLESTVRPSLAIYNSVDDVDALAFALRRLNLLGT
jgi:cysteine desulfurase/selenocysteine lyase